MGYKKRPALSPGVYNMKKSVQSNLLRTPNTSIIPYGRGCLSIGGMTEILAVTLWILRIDKRPRFGYTVDDERETTTNLEVVMVRKGTDSNGDKRRTARFTTEN